MIRMILSVAFALSIPASASAQTLNMMKGIDAPHYDAQRTTWGPTSDIVNMFQDTLVALDWDGRTPLPYLAKSWTLSELKNTIQLSTHEKPIRPMAMVWLRALLRLAKSTINANDSSGGSGISHVKVWICSGVNGICAPY